MIKGTDYTGVSVIFFCHDGEGEFLMAKRSQNARDERGRWDIGGGGVKFGEAVEDALRREIGEEYGTRVLAIEPLGYRDVHRTHEDRKTHWIALDFKVQVDRDLVRIAEPTHIDEIRWYTPDTLPDPTHSQFPRFLELYREKLFGE